MWTFIIIVSGVVLSVYGLTQSIRHKHLQEKKNDISAQRNVSRKRNAERYYNRRNDDGDGEMTEEEMIAEEYYFYSDKE